MEELEARKKMEADPHSGRMFAYVYTLEDKRFATVQKVALSMLELTVKQIGKWSDIGQF